MNTKLLHRSFAGLAFFISLVTYMLTVQPSVPFWDCGEFTAAAVQQQVPHPPGAPLFLMVGKVFHLLIPFGDEGWRVNLVSVVASAVSVLLLYLIAVKVFNSLRGKGVESFEEAMAVYGSSFVGALAFTFSDTFWFNAVESEVYAASTLFVALVVYLMMRWNERADEPGHERYILLIAYMMGLSTGVHLLSILAVFSIVLLVYFRKYEVTTGGLVIAGAIAVVLFFGIYPGIVKWFPALLAGNWPFKNEAKEYIIEGSLFIKILAILSVPAALVGIWISIKNKHQVAALACSAFVLMILGYSTYAHILLRANAYTPMNENNPNNLEKLVSYLGREQYGDAPMWPRRYRTDDRMFTDRYKQYGEWNDFGYKVVTRERDGVSLRMPDYSTGVNTAGELSYLWNYQIDHMYLRYFFWNFVGRMSDLQDEGVAWPFATQAASDKINRDTGYADIFPIKFYALPLLFGLIGLVFHFYRDPRMAWVYLLMFLAMGVIAAVYQNQQNPQPRERDYFYVGSFMIYCLWIGMGVYALIEQLYQQKSLKASGVMGIIGASLVLVPGIMATQGWKMHSRAGNFLPFDYAYNILQSVEKDAIVFTNGDNDTFPVWFMQDVEGVRRDVRIVNLSLGNTLWYVDQLKNQEPWGAKKVPISFPDESIQVEDDYDPKALSLTAGPARQEAIPVPRHIMEKYTNDPALLNDGHMRFTFIGTPRGQSDYIFRVQDQLVLNILHQTKWERPIYYSMSVGPDAFCGLEGHFRMEGMALRICPVPVSQGKGYGAYEVSEELMDKTILNILPDDEYHKEPHYGFKLRNLNNRNVYYDEVHRRLMMNYRGLYMNYATWLVDHGKEKKAIAVLDSMNKLISMEQFPLAFQQQYQLGDIYKRAGATVQQAQAFATLSVQSSERIINDPERLKNDPYVRYAFIIASDGYQLLEQYDKAIGVLQRYAALLGDDPTVQLQLDQIEVTRLEKQGKYAEAVKAAESIAQRYAASKGQYAMGMAFAMQQKAAELRKKAGLPPAAGMAAEGSSVDSAQ